MALRSPGSARHDDLVAASELPRRAQQLLAVGNLDGYRRLFESIESIADPNRRHWAGLGLIEQGLAANTSAPVVRRTALLARIAEGAIELLEREPSEPTLLRHAGVILSQLWSLDAAQALLEAAKRLDPQLERVDDELDALAARRSLARGARRRSALEADLSRRALDLAARAAPAEGLRLSLCMIVRNEEEMLPRCLAAVAGAVWEVVIVDTGSTDATIEIAR
jgi:hypothetical protein